MSLFPAYGVTSETSRYPEVHGDDDEQEKRSSGYKSFPLASPCVAGLDVQQSITDRFIIDDEKQLGKIGDSEKSKRKAIYDSDTDSSLSCDEKSSTQRHKKERQENEIRKKHKKRKKKRKHEGKEKNGDDKTSHGSKHSLSETEIPEASSEISQLPPSDKVFIGEVLPVIKTTYAFTIDRRPDNENVSYGCIYRTKIARYRTFGSFKNRSKGHKASRKAEASIGRYFSSKERKSVVVCDKLPLSCAANDDPKSEFIPLQRCSDIEIPGISSGNTTPVEDQHDSGIRKKVAEYNQRLALEPHNEALWLDFVDFQKTAMCEKQKEQRTKDDVETWVKVDRNSLVEIKSAVLEKAVEKNPSSKVLRLAQLELNGTLWDLEKLSQEWKKLVFSFANDAEVWRRYIRFVQCNLSMFTVSRVVGVYAKCLGTLDAINKGTMTSHRELPNSVENMIEIFYDMCTFLYESGHIERAMALFQAQLEYNLFCPLVLQDADKSDQMDFLSAFWDSGVPRFGELNALGWATWVNSKGESSTSSGSSNIWSSKERDEEEDEKLINDHDDQGKLWLAIESSRTSRHWLPWKQSSDDADEEEECEDTERIVLFEDISKCLFFVKSKEHRFALLSMFFDFLDRLSEVRRLSRNFSTSSTTAMENAREIYRRSDAELLFKPHLSVGSLLENYKVFRSNVMTQVSDQFEGEFRTFLHLRDIDFQVNELDCCDDSNRKTQSKELKKFIKSLLNVDRNNLAIWQRYAAFDFNGSNRKEARKVFDTAITMSGAADAFKGKGYDACIRCLLYRTYASLELGVDIHALERKMLHAGKKRSDKGSDSDSISRTLSILVALGDSSCGLSFGASIAPTRLLKCQRYYSQNLDALMEQLNSVTDEKVSECVLPLPYVGDTLVHWASCYAMFQYLTGGIEAMSTFFDGILSRLASSYSIEDKCASAVLRYKQTVHEMCTESYIGLLQYHVSNSISPLSALRVPLMSQLGRFRESRFLLQSLIDLESAFSITGHLRRYFHENLSSTKTSIVPLFAVLSEFKRIQSLKSHQADTSCVGVVETGVTNQLRAWFEVAINQPASQHCILIWRFYMYFEAQMNNKNNVKGVFYRALQHCPWAKSIYLDCVRYVPEILQEVNDLLTEKELRIRTPLEELALLMSGKETLNERPAEDENVSSSKEQNDIVNVECNL